MPDSITFGSVTPLIPAGGDLSVAIAFYENQLGFTTTYQDEGMAIVNRDQSSLMLIKNDDRHWAENTSLRIAIVGVEALYADYQARGFEGLRSLGVKPWGTKEFAVIDPTGVCLAFYERI